MVTVHQPNDVFEKSFEHTLEAPGRGFYLQFVFTPEGDDSEDDE